MKMFVAFFAAAAAFIGCCTSQAIEMSVMEGKGVYKMGETITIKCIVKGVNAIPLGWVLDWYKVLTYGEKVHIGTNTRVEQTMEEEKPGHFELMAVNERIDGQSVPVFTLKIKDVKHVDSGLYQCSISPSEYHKETEVSVFKRPEKLSMEVDVGNGFSEVAVPEEFTLHRNAKLEVKCTSSGGNPTLKLVIKVGDEVVESTGSSHRRSEAGRFRYDELITFEVIETATLQVDSRMGGGKVSCENQDDEGNALLSREFSVKLEGAAPILHCPSNRITRALEETRVNITCIVEASPAIIESDVLFYWYPSKVAKTVENRESVRPNRRNGLYTVVMLETRDGMVEISLLIDRLDPETFTDYHVHVSNSKGSTEKVVTLHRDYINGRTDTASSSRMSVGMIGIAVVLNVLFGLCRYSD